jgi:hypothetical protein
MYRYYDTFLTKFALIPDNADVRKHTVQKQIHLRMDEGCNAIDAYKDDQGCRGKSIKMSNGLTKRRYLYKGIE